MDDDLIFRSEIAKLLTENGYEVTSCDTASEAKALIEDGAYDLVISDIFIKVESGFLPDGGISLLGWMQNRVDIPVIAVTGFVDRQGGGYLQQMSALGASEVMSKPIKPDQLLDSIKKLISSAH